MDDIEGVDELADCRAEIARIREEVAELRHDLRERIGDVAWQVGTLANAFHEPRLFGLDVLLIGMRRSPGQVLEAKYIIGEGLKRLASQHPPGRSGRREMVEGIVAAAAAEGYDPAEVQAYLDDSAGARAERLCDDLLAAGMYAGLDVLVAFVADALRVHPDDAREMVEAHRAAGFGRNELYEVLDPTPQPE